MPFFQCAAAAVPHWRQISTQAALGFGRFRVLLRQRQLLADELPVELGTRAFDLLLALLEADGSLVTKEQLLARGWPGIAVAEDSVKVHVSALRKALGEDRDFIRTEFGRGYRFTAAVQLDQDRREGCSSFARTKNRSAGRIGWQGRSS
jgi:DNA-binding winged helix-turn-helix (wHTH) protein